ncbi:ras-domain-containing protein [Mycena latifolia]|nr:ras-domain-containing protein [Mycena latifolia]
MGWVGLGDAAVGKSSLLVRLPDQRLLANCVVTHARVGVEFRSQLPMLPDAEGMVVKLQCWATAGVESFRSILAVLDYDVTSRRSFDNVRTWLADVRARTDAHVSCIVVGKKVDLCERDGRLRRVPVVSQGLLFAEASAKNGAGVEDTFVRTAESVLEKVRRGAFDDRSPGVKLSRPGAALPAPAGG